AGFGGEGNAHGGDKEADQEKGVAGEKITFHNGAPERKKKYKNYDNTEKVVNEIFQSTFSALECEISTDVGRCEILPSAM
ncbi:MAG: hypothetical protein VZQ29_12205, partial [Succiniclasticum sp.]|nr:hypothetical protein [Succiniclasticum sp.]